jgi:integrase
MAKPSDEGLLSDKGLHVLLEKPGRYADGQGLYFRTLGLARAYWVYRYRAGGKEREMSLGPYPELSLEKAREKHVAERKAVVVDKADPLADRRAAKAAKAAAVVMANTPTFGDCADAYLASHEAGWRNPKHRDQWRMTLTEYCKAIRDTPVDQVDAKAVLKVLEPKWKKVPETASRLRARIEAVLASAQVKGHINADRPNPARWKGWLDQMLPNPKKVGERRGHHAAMPYEDLPAFMARLAETPGVAAKALAFTTLTAARSGEVLGATWDEIDFDDATWTVPASRMKMQKPHAVPLSDAAVAILRAQEAVRGKNPYVFPGARPRQPLSIMAMTMAMRRLGVGHLTVHGMRSASRSWMADNGVEFELAEACLAHAVGNAVVQAYQRSSMLERRRPVMQAWASFLTGEGDATKVVALNGRRKRL